MLTDAPPVAATPPAAPPPRRTSSSRLVTLLVGSGGLVLLLAAVFVFRSMDTVPRSAIAALGTAGVWIGVQRLGRDRYGADFSLGLVVAIGYLLLLGALVAAYHLGKHD